MNFWEILGGIVGVIVGCVLIAWAADHFGITFQQGDEDDE